MTYLKKIFIGFLCTLQLVPLFSADCFAEEAVPSFSAKAVVLIEKETGQVLYENNSHEKLSIASITKIMTLLIAAEEISSGNLSFEDTAVCSDYAGSMDGSVIWLEAGEEMSVGDLIKSMVIASANDACVMLAEHIEGSEAAFVERMNKRAKELGMNNTSFKNCVGYDDPQHCSTAADVAKMAAELRKYDYYDGFLMTRLDSVRTGTKRETQLLNTNKLINSYSGITGLKTGTTDNAGYCLCITAEKGGMELIGVVLGCESDEKRFSEAEALMDYGFGGFERIRISPDTSELLEIPVSGGVKKTVDTRFSGTGEIILQKGSSSLLKYSYSRAESVAAPVEKGQLLGYVNVTSGETVVATAKIIAAEEVEELDYKRCIKELLERIFSF